MDSLKVIDTGVLTVKDIDKLKEFPKESGINRNIDKNNVNRIKSSMEQLYIPSVIKVNKDWFILDGQHSKQALMELAEGNENLEIAYTMIDTQGRDRETCILLNTISKKWNYDDFVDIWADSGNENYIWFKEFKEKYNLNFITARYILTGINRGLTQREEDIEFKNGEFVVTQGQRIRATRIARQLQEVKKIIPKVVGNTRTFQLAFSMIARNEKYDHERMTTKLEFQYDRIHKCSTQLNYVEMLQDIYNYKSRDKVEF